MVNKSNSDYKQILTRCASSSDFYTSPPSSPLHSSSYPRGASTMRTALGRETEVLQQEDEKKSQELARVKNIVEQENKRVESLKSKVEGNTAHFLQLIHQLTVNW